MNGRKYYTLPELPYGKADLAPIISEEQLTIHHDKHHLAYVDGANALLKKMEKAREEKSEVDEKAVLKELSFNLGGHRLHSLFWKNLSPVGSGGNPDQALEEIIVDEYGSMDRFKSEFNRAAVTTEGSGWAALTYCFLAGRPIIMQIEKHNNNVYPTIPILLVLDVWEHAYYIDHKNDRKTYVESFWKLVNWNEVNQRFNTVINKIHDKKE